MAQKNVWVGSVGDYLWLEISFIQIQILKTDLHTFLSWISWENLFEDQSVFHEVITLNFLTTLSHDYVLITLGENRFLPFSGLKGLKTHVLLTHTTHLSVTAKHDVSFASSSWFLGLGICLYVQKKADIKFFTESVCIQYLHMRC